jgi:ATP:ADP antiporter, AAA family
MRASARTWSRCLSEPRLLQDRLARALGIEAGEVAPVARGFAMFFLLFAGYFLLRPVRETMGIAGGVKNLQWLFTGTFVAMLVALPLFGWVAARVQRRRILFWVYGFFCSNLLLFALGFSLLPDDVWLARGFYIWLSMFNLIAISLAWSVLVDVFSSPAAKRLFALMASGASIGGLVGPMLGVLLVGPVGHSGLLVLAAALLTGSALCVRSLQRWRSAQSDAGSVDTEAREQHRPLGGSPFEGAWAVMRSPYLLGIALYVVLLASVSTFLYFDQARLVEAAYPLKTDQTRIFGLIDIAVQSLAILSQVFITGRLAQRLGVGVLLIGVPLLMVVGFLWLALAPTFLVLAIVMIMRRSGEYAFVRPGREMLYTPLAPGDKYKAKNFNDTVVYRGADAVSGWVKAGVDMVAQNPAVAMGLGALVATGWMLTGVSLTRRYRAVEPK